MLEALPAVTPALFAERRRQAPQFIFDKAAWPLVPIDGDRGLAVWDLDGNDFRGEQALLLGLDRPLKARYRVIVLLLAGEVIFLRAEVAAGAHVDIVVNVPQAILNHGIDEFAIAQAISATGLGQQVGGQGHVFGPAGDDQFGVADLDRLSGQHDRFEAGTADLVDGRGADRRSQAGAERGLTCHVLAKTGADHVAEDHFVDLVRGDVCALNGRLDGRAAQRRRGTCESLRRRNCPAAFSLRRPEKSPLTSFDPLLIGARAVVAE